MATKKIEFRTAYSEPVETITPSGEKEEDVWAMKLNEYGEEEFYVKGKTNVYEKIQAFLEETKIENILQRCIDTGDISLLEKAKGEYMDITEMPKTMIEAHQKIMEAEENFVKLPVEIKERFDNNFNKYLATAGTEEWIQKMTINNEGKIEENKETNEKETKEE